MTKTFDPRTVLIVAAIIGSLSVFANHPTSAHITFAFATLLALAFGTWRTALITAVIYLVAQSLSHAAWLLGGPASVALVMLAYMTQKLLVLVLLGSFVSKTTTLEGIGAALAKMKTPRTITLPLMVMFRFLPTIRSDIRALTDSLKTRAIIDSPLKLFIHPLRWIELVAVPLLMRATKISDELTASALTRGLGKTKNPAIIYSMGFTIADLALSTCVLLVTAAVGWLQMQSS